MLRSLCFPFAQLKATVQLQTPIFLKNKREEEEEEETKDDLHERYTR